jgi:hypothetical protein
MNGELMTSPDSESAGRTLRRTFAVIEFVAAAFLVLLGVDSATAHRVGGDGIGTGLAHTFGPVLLLVALAVAYAANAAWRGTPRWWVRQIVMLGLSAGLVLVTLIVLVKTGS